MCTYEHSLELMSMVLWHHKRSWVLMSAYGPMAPSSWVFMAAHECSCTIMSILEHQLALICTHRKLRAALNTHEQPWVLMSSHEHSWAWRHGARSTLESSRTVMSGGPWDHGHLLFLMSTDDAIAPYSIMLTSANKCWCVLISTHKGSIELMSASMLHWTINQKC